MLANAWTTSHIYGEMIHRKEVNAMNGEDWKPLIIVRVVLYQYGRVYLVRKNGEAKWSFLQGPMQENDKSVRDFSIQLAQRLLKLNTRVVSILDGVVDPNAAAPAFVQRVHTEPTQEGVSHNKHMVARDFTHKQLSELDREHVLHADVLPTIRKLIEELRK